MVVLVGVVAVIVTAVVPTILIVVVAMRDLGVTSAMAEMMVGIIGVVVLSLLLWQ